jgi:hypothetical protein
MDLVTGTSLSHTNTTALETAHFFRNRLIREEGEKLYKRDHFPVKQKIYKGRDPFGRRCRPTLPAPRQFYKTERRPETRLKTRMINATTSKR